MKAYDSHKEYGDENKWSRLLSEDKGAATRAGIGAPQKKSRSREKEERSPKTPRKRRDAGETDLYAAKERNLFFLFFFPTCPPEILSAASSAPGALTDSETKTPQPRCCAQPRPLLLKGQQPGWRRRRRRWRKKVVVVVVGGGPIISHGGLYQSCEEHSVAFEDPHFFIGPVGRISKLVQNISF